VVEGGLKARSKRGAIGETWWSGRFIAVLDGFGMGGRLTRGKNYARRGQVISLVIEPGMVSARVQGSRARPYRVRIGLRAYDKAEWGRVTDALVEDAWYTAKLLAGAMPEEIVDLFDTLGLALFPARQSDLTLDCSCPDWGVPCKHLAAVFYLLAERFDQDPFEILAWRGRDREELLAALSARRQGGLAADRGATDETTVPLSELLDTYWSAPAQPTEGPHQRFGAVAADAVLAQAPPIALRARGMELRDALRPAYAPPAAQRDAQ
jgi:uncharacterized Zn finger protein